MNGISVSVVIPTVKALDQVSDLVASIGRQNFNDGMIEVLIVSNFADASFVNLQHHLQGPTFTLRHLVSGFQGVNHARNKGIEEAQGEILFFVDDDCLLKDKGYLQELIDLHAHFSEATAIGGIYQPSKKASSIDRAYNLISRKWQKPSTLGSPDNRELVGGNVSYKKVKLEEYNLKFNPEITYGGAETEFHSRLRSAGAELLCFDDLEVYHNPDLTTENLVAKAFYQAWGQKNFNVSDSYNFGIKPEYQDPSIIWAAQQCKSDYDLAETLLYMSLYNWVYQKAKFEEKVPLSKLQKSAKQWLADRRSENFRGIQ